MTKQEEIREEVEILIRACLLEKGMDANISDSLSHALMLLLDGLGVVIKVDTSRSYDFDKGFYTCDICGYVFETDSYTTLDKMVKEHYNVEHSIDYVAVEPLAKEAKDVSRA